MSDYLAEKRIPAGFLYGMCVGIIALCVLFSHQITLLRGQSESHEICFSQVANGGGLSTAFILMSTSRTIATEGVLRLRDQAGNSAEQDIDIPPNGTVFWSAPVQPQTADQAVTGYACFVSNQPVAGIATYDCQPRDRVVYSVAALGQGLGNKFAIPYETSSKTDLGIALANTGAERIVADIYLLDELGNSLADVVVGLQGGEQTTWLLNELFPLLLQNNAEAAKGTIVIEETTQQEKLSVLGLQLEEQIVYSIPVLPLG